MRWLAICLAAASVSGGAAQLTPMRFPPEPGWHAGDGRVHACPGVSGTVCRQVGSWASTTHWRDCVECNPPHRTLAALGRNGIAISVLAASEDGGPRRRLSWPPRLRARDARGPVEGGPATVSLDSRAGRLNGFETYVCVFYGRRRPTASQVSRAQAELSAARLPGT